MRWMVIVGVAALIAGTGLGYAAGQSEPNEQATGTTAVESNEVPASCLDALDYADEGFVIAAASVSLMAEGFGVAGDAILAVSNYDVAGIESATAEMRLITADIESQTDEIDSISLPYRQARDDCREGR